MANDRPRLELSAPQILGGALAAASAAVASSWLGVAGTVLGAVIVSLVVSVGSALYTHSLERSSRVIRETLPVSPILPARTSTARQTAATAVLPAVATPAADDAVVADATTREPSSRRGGSVSWRTVGVSALASLALAAAVLTGFETFVGKPASSIIGAGNDGGTTVSRLVGDDSSDSGSPQHSDPVAPTDTGTTTPEGGSGTSQGVAAQQGQPSQTPDPLGSTDAPATPTEPTDTGSTPTDTGGTPAQAGPTDATPTD